MATKRFCDNCQQEIIDKDFRFEARVQEIKQLLISNNARPQLVDTVIDFCKKCYDARFK